jgi:hypothetical protein
LRLIACIDTDVSKLIIHVHYKITITVSITLA